MSLMVLSVLPTLVCVLCVVVVPAGSEDVCFSYVDMFDVSHDTQKCNKYCCGSCSIKYCCSHQKDRLNQGLCSGSSASGSTRQIAVIVGSVVGSFLVLLCVVLIICFVAPCCFCYMKCRKRPNERQIIVINSNTPQQPSCPGYQAVPAGPPMPTAPPPSYQESTNPTHFSGPSGQPIHPFQPPSQSNAPPPYSEDPQQPPYNPSHNTNH